MYIKEDGRQHDNSDYKDKCLVCFFSFGRPEITKKSFENLLENIRLQDRLLVIDQCGLNKELYIEYFDRIDWLQVWKRNYGIGVVYIFIRKFLESLIGIQVETSYTDDKNWVPDYINIVESDSIGKKGWIDRVMKGFNLENVGIVSGFDSELYKPIGKINEFLVKKTVCGVNIVIRKDFCLKYFNVFKEWGQDRQISIINNNTGKKILILPGEIIHIG